VMRYVRVMRYVQERRCALPWLPSLERIALTEQRAPRYWNA